MPRKSMDMPCPQCAYKAWDQADLDGHIQFAHAKPGAPADTPAPDAPANPPPASGKAPVPDAPDKAPATSREPEATLPPGIFVPKENRDFHIAEDVGRLLWTVAQITKRGEIVNLKVIGPAGVGKSSLAREYAATFRRPYFEVHWGMYADASEVWGKDRLSMEKGTYYEQGKLVDAYETPGCVILHDEPNRCPPELLNTQFPLWDWRREGWIPELQRMVRVAPGVTMFAALNEGGQYVGTNPMDKAIRERFTRTILLKWPPMKVEAGIIRSRTGVDKEVAEKLARFARDVRRNPKIGCAPSTRQLLVAAEDVKEGLALHEAVLYSVVNDLDERADRTALLQHLQVLGKVDDAFVNPTAQEDD